MASHSSHVLLCILEVLYMTVDEMNLRANTLYGGKSDMSRGDEDVLSHQWRMTAEICQRLEYIDRSAIQPADPGPIDWYDCVRFALVVAVGVPFAVGLMVGVGYIILYFLG